MLLSLRNYLRCQKIASTQQLARALHMDIMALQPLLDFWVKKGVIVPIENNKTCASTCFKCQTNTLTYFFYQEDNKVS